MYLATSHVNVKQLYSPESSSNSFTPAEICFDSFHGYLILSCMTSYQAQYMLHVLCPVTFRSSLIFANYVSCLVFGFFV